MARQQSWQHRGTGAFRSEPCRASTRPATSERGRPSSELHIKASGWPAAKVAAKDRGAEGASADVRGQRSRGGATLPPLPMLLVMRRSGVRLPKAAPAKLLVRGAFAFPKPDDGARSTHAVIVTRYPVAGHRPELPRSGCRSPPSPPERAFPLPEPGCSPVLHFTSRRTVRQMPRARGRAIQISPAVPSCSHWRSVSWSPAIRGAWA